MILQLCLEAKSRLRTIKIIKICLIILTGQGGPHKSHFSNGKSGSTLMSKFIHCGFLRGCLPPKDFPDWRSVNIRLLFDKAVFRA